MRLLRATFQTGGYTMLDPSATEQVSVVESFRERVARHVTGTAPPSNYEAMIAAIVRRIGPPTCEACDGLGYVSQAGEQLKAYEERLAHMHQEIAKLTADSLAPKPDEGDYERAKQDQDERKRLALRVQRIQKNMFDERWAFKLRSKCEACNGSGLGKRKQKRARVRPDAIFTTVTCPDCRGCDARDHDLLPQAHHGASGGKVTRDSEFFKRGQTCPECLGRAYRTPLSARPMQKTAEVLDGFEVDERFQGRRERRRRLKPRPPESPAELIASLQESEPLVAVATVVLLGPHGDEWAQHPWGRCFSIWPLVSAGQQLVQEAASASGERDWYRNQIDVLRLEREAAERDPELVRAATLVSIADGEARRLEAKVEAALDLGEAA